MFEDFYSTFATVSLTVTGLWMYVAQARFREWMADRDHFRRASAISVKLAFPGLMCLFALIDPASRALWRWSFGVVSLAAIALLVHLRRESSGPWGRSNTIGQLVAIVIFACIGLVAVAPDLVEDLGARRAEFFLFILLLVDGIFVGWLMLFYEHGEEQSPARRPPP